MTNLGSLSLGGNQLSGKIPPELGNRVIFLQGNQLEVPATNDVDRAVLTTLYNATDGENWNANKNWLSDKHVFEWHGVAVGSNGRVTGLNLSENSLIGEIPPELGNLTSLRVLNLNLNGLQGEIPPELGNLGNLQSLGLFGNGLSGCVPASLEGQLGDPGGLLQFC